MTLSSPEVNVIIDALVLDGEIITFIQLSGPMGVITQYITFTILSLTGHKCPP